MINTNTTNAVDHLLAPGRLEALEFLHIASVEGVQRINEPLFICVPQGLQHRMHQLQQENMQQKDITDYKQHLPLLSENLTNSPKL